MNQCITFADVNIIPEFSEVASRADVDISMNKRGFPYMGIPIISSNMDTVTGSEMTRAMISNGAQACLHRFSTIEENVKMFEQSCIGATGEGARMPLVSIGLGMKEIERAEALRDAGACTFIIDVNHGANIQVVKQVRMFREVLGNDLGLVVGNFATGKTVSEFVERCGLIMDGFKIGIGGGSTCTTRIKTGVGIPQLSAIIDTRPVIHKLGITLIADGAMKTAGDVGKAFVAGAHMVMTGGMLAGCDETPGDTFYDVYDMDTKTRRLVTPDEFRYNSRLRDHQETFKKYRGSASHESYLKQGKVAKHRAAEGESFLVRAKGPVSDVLQDIEGGIRGTLSMTGCFTINELHQKAQFVHVSSASSVEAGAHGKSQ